MSSLLRPVRLPEIDRDAEDHHRHDDQRIDALSQRASDGARDEQDDDKGIGEQVEQLNDGREAADRNWLIRAVRDEEACRLDTAQS